MIPSSLVAQLRAVQKSLLPDACSVSRNTPTRSGAGQVDSWAAVGTYACRTEAVGTGGSEGTLGGGSVAAVNQWIVWLPALADVTVLDRLAYGARTFEVVRVDAKSYETVRRCICREVT